jgi:glycosyltransferase involved in cell wall biosynthesis
LVIEAMANKKSGVIYTCITGGYDDLKNHTYIDQDWDYICFSDDLSIGNENNSSWQIRPLFFDKLDNVRNQRWHKLHPHILFPEYEKSIWIDGNLDVLNEGLFDDVQKIVENRQLMSIPPHPKRTCIYDEFEACIVMGKDDPSVMREQIDLIRKDAFPENLGLFETSIVFRIHNDKRIIKAMDDWWWWVKKHSRRDQLSLTYVLWKNNLSAVPLTDVSYRNGNNIGFSYGESHVTKEELMVQMDMLRAEISNLKDIISCKDDEIMHMTKSKFWKLRSHYLAFSKKFSRQVEISRKMIISFKKRGFFPTLLAVLKYGIFRPFFISRHNVQKIDYDIWMKKNEKFDVEKIKEEIGNFGYLPKISIITPVYDVDARWLDRCIKSVSDQFYGNWELCLHDDASTKKETIECLKRWEKKDARIKVSYGKKNMHISGASNEALKLATGEFIALLDNDDELSSDALFEAVKAINENPNADFIYSDEDKMELSGERVDPFFKPDWSLDLFLSLNYLCHLAVMRKSIGDKIGWFRVGYEGAQDFDLFLRFISQTKNIKHIPKILYHWRKLETSTAKSIGSKKYAHAAGRKALNDYLIDNNIRAVVETGYGETNYRLKYEFDADDRVSVIIPFKDKVDVLKACVESILQKSTYKNYELLLISNNSSNEETFDYLEKLKKYNNIRVFERNVPFNYPALNNFAVQKSTGNFILFLNNDTEVITPSWMEEMLMHANRADVGAVGALLYYPNKKIQHSGVIMGMTGLAGHIFSGQRKEDAYYNLASYTRNYLAVTAACLLVSKEKFLKAGGFNELFTVCGNDVDFCLRLYENGYVNVCTPYAELYHHESLSRDKQPPECDIDISKKRYAPYIGKDIYFNPNLSLISEAVKINLN